jgi:hypothetical protein
MRAATKQILGVLVALAAIGGCAKPEPVAKSASSPVDEIVARNLAARGGKERIQALKSIREYGTATASGGRVAKLMREIKKPDLYRLEFSYEGTKSVFAYDGKQGWQVAPLQGKFAPEVVPSESRSVGVDQRDLEGALVDWREKGHQVEIVGRETLPGGEADKLKVTLRGGAVRYDYVDVKTSLVVRSEVGWNLRGRPTTLVNDYSDFRKEGDLVVPHVIESQVKNRPQVMHIVVDKVELDPELDDARFQMPQ